jgi:glycosyltransferase involved in cell wall biosynthesis
MLRILAQINYSNPKNPAADSGIQMHASMAKAVLDQHPNIYFYVMLPESALEAWKGAFDHERIGLLVTPLPPRQSGGAFHFDSPALDRIMDFRRMDVDVLLLSQPELTPAFLDYFNKRHFFHIPAISYIHWLDWRKYDAIKNRAVEPSVLSTLTGAMLSSKVGCNSVYGRDRILKLARHWFADELVDGLARKLIPLCPGIDALSLSCRRLSHKKKRKIQIIVPHRAQKYTGFKTLIERYLPRVWNLRRDFEVILTNPSRYDFITGYQRDYPFIKVVQLDRSEYINTLSDADIVIGSHVGCNQWSVATLEALCAGCIPLMSSEGFYKEMFEPIVTAREWPKIADHWFYFRSEFANRLLGLMDNLDTERRRAWVIGRRARKWYDWKARALEWGELFESVAQTSPIVGGDSKAFRRLVYEIKRRGKCTKAELLRMMGWHPKSRHIPWTKYRRRLLTIVDEMPNAAEVSFCWNGGKPVLDGSSAKRAD